ncbi:YciI family protein [Erwinia oleae]|uniref:YciI family protein n=1 Tax=Erwinia oleae TaxID=796334 RepID=UPI0005567F64|nr:YciI family protein [Erwinia oleae]
MSIYIVRMDHPEGIEWNTVVREHVLYLKELIKQGKLLASGPLKNTPLRAGFLIFRAETRDEVQMMVKADPFARENLIAHLDIQEWDPLFGQLSALSSHLTVDELQDLVD